MHGRGLCGLSILLSVGNGAGGAPLHTDRRATAQIADEGQTGAWMQGDHAEGARLQAPRTPVAVLRLQNDGGIGVVPVQGTGGTGGYARSPPAQSAYSRAVRSQRFVLEDPQSRSVNAEETIVPGDAGYLAGATAAAEFISDDYPSQGHISDTGQLSGIDRCVASRDLWADGPVAASGEAHW